MTGAGRWAAGATASALAHLGAGAVLVWAILPDDAPVQPMPQTEMEVVAHTLDRTEATATQPDSPRATEAEPDGGRLATGAIPTSRAEPVAAQGAAMAATPAETTDLAAVQTPGQALPSATQQVETSRPQPPDTQRVTSAAPAQTALTTSQPRADTAAATAPLAPTVTTAQAVAAAALPTTAPRSDRLTSGTPPVQVAALAVPQAGRAAPVASDAPTVQPVAQPAVPVAPATPAPTAAAPATPDLLPAAAAAPVNRPVDPAAPQADSVKAALAFPGTGGPVDPVSFAAFQSFMQPGDATTQGDPVRDGVAGLLAQVPCARLQVGFDPDTTTLTVNGHIPDGDLRGTVLSALQTQMGADIAVADNLLILPRPQCGALSGIASVGLPQSTDQFTNPLVIGEDAHARVFGFVAGDYLSLDMTAPDYDAVIYLDYFDADGNVLHLEPNEYSPLRRASAKSAQQIGAKSAEDEGLQLIIAPPFGQEIAVAFAASHPLYEGLRPIQEPAEPYLDWLRDRVAATRAAHPDFKGEWVYFFVTTSDG